MCEIICESWCNIKPDTTSCGCGPLSKTFSDCSCKIRPANYSKGGIQQPKCLAHCIAKHLISLKTKHLPNTRLYGWASKSLGLFTPAPSMEVFEFELVNWVFAFCVSQMYCNGVIDSCQEGKLRHERWALSGNTWVVSNNI